MEEKRTGLFENGLIWFGAGVSIAEILTGTYLAPLGMGKGLAAIIVGHIIGCLMLFLAGVIGGKVRKSAMETVKMSFGQKGSILFAVLNVLQLVGWTAIMIYDGALAADGVMHTGRWIWCLVIGALIILWIVIGITNLGKINTVAMAALFILTLILCKVIFTGSGAGTPSDDSMTFGAAVELAVAMPLSWLPLISDYTREAKEPVKATAVSAVTYGIVSCWMYVIGMGAAIITGEYDIAQIMLEGRPWYCGPSDYCIFNSNNDISGCLLRRNFQRDCRKQMEWKACGHRCHRHWNHRSDCISDGQHHRFPLSDRLGLCTDDRNPDCRLFPAETGQEQPGRTYSESDHLGDWIRCVQNSYECRYAGRKYIAGYGDHDHPVSDRREINT